MVVGWVACDFERAGGYRSGLIGVVVNVVCRGCHPSGCFFFGGGGDVRIFLRVGALVVVYFPIVDFPLGVASTVVSVT